MADFGLFMNNDDALLRAVHAHWVLVPEDDPAMVPSTSNGNGHALEVLHQLAHIDPKGEKVGGGDRGGGIKYCTAGCGDLHGVRRGLRGSLAA